MDLSTIQARLSREEGAEEAYTNPRQFLQDLNLIVNNSCAFNRDSGTQVYADTRWLAQWIKQVARRRLRGHLMGESAGGTTSDSARPEDGGGAPRRRRRGRPRTRAYLRNHRWVKIGEIGAFFA